MRHIRIAPVQTVVLAGLLAGLGACGGDEPVRPDPDPQNTPPALGALADQTLAINTLTAGSLVVELTIEDPDDDSFAVTAVSTDPAVLPPVERACGLDPCPLTLAPVVSTSASVTVTVTVADGRGGEASTSFALDIASRLVTTAADDGAGSLRGVIADAEPGDVIGFDTGGAFGSQQTIALTAQLVLDRALTIIGPGTDALIVSGDGATRAFRMEGGADVKLRDLTVAGGVAPLESLASDDVRLGGCLLVDTGGVLTLDGVRVTGCTAPDAPDLSAGGGVANLGGTLTIRNSELDANSAATLGGAVYSTGALEITGTGLHDNAATGADFLEGGGALYNTGTATVTDSYATGNTGRSGGAISNGRDGVLALRSVTLDFNTAGAVGGGVFTLGELTVDSSTIRGNGSGSRGGGVDYFDGPGGTVSGTLIQANSSMDGAGIDIVGADAVVSIVDSELLENVATGRGGGLSFGGFLTTPPDEALQITGTAIADNSAESGGGIAVVDGGQIEVRASGITGNTASNSGGGMFLDEFEDAELRNTQVTGNAAGVAGGGIYAEINGDPEARLAVQDSSLIADNVAGSWGGGIFAGDDGTGLLSVLLQRSRVSDNRADLGGGIFIDDGFLVLFGGDNSFDGVTIERNVAVYDGGGVYANGTQIQILEPSVVIANEAGEDGGGLYVTGADLLVEGGGSCTILANVADADENGAGSGGGIYADATSDLTVQANEVCLNSPDDIVIG